MNAGKFLRIVLCLAALVIPAFADSLIDFSGGTGGTITGSATTATGSGIVISTLTSVITPLHNGQVTTVTGGALTFSATGGSFGGGIYTYTGGTFSISGTDATAGASGTLLSGTISSLTVNLGGTLALVSGANTINSNLAAYFGVPTTGWVVTNGSMHLFNTTGGAGGTYSASVQSTDIPDTNTPVPEPASILLLGTVLVGATQLVRRRASRA